MFKRLVMAYVGVGFVIAVIQNWMAHTSAGGSIPEVLFSAMSFGEKMQVVIDLGVVPLLLWPIRVWAMIRGG